MGSESIVTGQTPQTVISGGRDYEHGFRPSDAALVRAGQSQDAHMFNLVAAYLTAVDGWDIRYW